MMWGGSPHRIKDPKIGPYPDTPITEEDLAYLLDVIRWQMPSMVRLEKEVQEHPNIHHGTSTVHQIFLMSPQDMDPQNPDEKKKMNTQYFDYHPYASRDALERKARELGFDLYEMTSEQLWVNFM